MPTATMRPPSPIMSRLREGLGKAENLEGDIHAASAGQFAYARDGVGRGGIDDVGGACTRRRRELVGLHVDSDDLEAPKALAI